MAAGPSEERPVPFREYSHRDPEDRAWLLWVIAEQRVVHGAKEEALQLAAKRFAGMELTEGDWERVGQIGGEIYAAKAAGADQRAVGGEYPAMFLSRSVLVDLLKRGKHPEQCWLGEVFTRIADRVYALKTAYRPANAKDPMGVEDLWKYIRGKWWVRLYEVHGYSKPEEKEGSFVLGSRWCVRVCYKYRMDAERDGVSLELRTTDEELEEIPEYLTQQLKLTEGDAELHIIGPSKTTVVRKCGRATRESWPVKKALENLWGCSAEWEDGVVYMYNASKRTSKKVSEEADRQAYEHMRALRQTSTTVVAEHDTPLVSLSP